MKEKYWKIPFIQLNRLMLEVLQCVAHNNWIERLIKKLKKFWGWPFHRLNEPLSGFLPHFGPSPPLLQASTFLLRPRPPSSPSRYLLCMLSADWWRHAEVKQQLNWPVRELSVAYECVLWLRQQSGTQWVGPVMAERTAHSQQLQPLTTKKTKSLIYQSFLGCLLIDGKFLPRETRENLSLFHRSFSVNKYWKF